MMNPYYSGYKTPLIVIIIAVLWTLFWKGYAVWTTVKKEQKGWFVVLLIFNTLGILEIIYLFAVAKKKWSDVKKVFLGIVMPKRNTKIKTDKAPKEENN
jgi:hypothetical protein